MEGHPLNEGTVPDLVIGDGNARIFTGTLEKVALESGGVEVDGVDAALDEEINRDEIEGDVIDDSIESVMLLAEHDNALVLPVWEPTGDAEVDTALEELATLDDRDIHDHASVFTSVHGRLHQRLSDLSA